MNKHMTQKHLERLSQTVDPAFIEYVTYYYGDGFLKDMSKNFEHLFPDSKFTAKGRIRKLKNYQKKDQMIKFYFRKKKLY